MLTKWIICIFRFNKFDQLLWNIVLSYIFFKT